MNKRPYWLDSDDSRTIVRGATRSAFTTIALAVVLVAVLGGIGYGIKVALSPVKGRTDTIIKNQDANNRINSQAYFEDLNANITSYTTQLRLAVKQTKAHPGDTFYETNFTGLYNTCVSAANQYNAASAKTLFHDWKTADLPEVINADDACPTE